MVVGCGDKESSTEPTVSEPDVEVPTETETATETVTETVTETSTQTATSTETVTDTDTETNTLPTGGGGSGDDTGDPEPTVDCDAVGGGGMVQWGTLTGFSTAEDFTFDELGNYVAVHQGNLVRMDYNGNVVEYIAPGFGEMSGTSILANGDIVIANPGSGAVIRVASNGGQETIISGINYPNGVTVDTEGYVYVSGHDDGQIYRVDPYDPSTVEIIADGMGGANGMAFSPNGEVLYVCSFYQSKIWSIRRDSGGWGEPHLIGQYGTGGLDGLNVDECGNLYVTEYIQGIVYRIDPNEDVIGSPNAQVIANLPSSWIPNLHWGRSITNPGFDDRTLYVADRGQGLLFALDVGVLSTPQVYSE